MANTDLTIKTGLLYEKQLDDNGNIINRIPMAPKTLSNCVICTQKDDRGNNMTLNDFISKVIAGDYSGDIDLSGYVSKTGDSTIAGDLIVNELRTGSLYIDGQKIDGSNGLTFQVNNNNGFKFNGGDITLDSHYKYIGNGSGLTNINPNNIEGILPITRGGTGNSTFTTNAVLLGNGTGAIKTKASVNGAFYSTGNNTEPNFGTLPIAQGGTNNTLFDNGNLIRKDPNNNKLISDISLDTDDITGTDNTSVPTSKAVYNTLYGSVHNKVDVIYVASSDSNDFDKKRADYIIDITTDTIYTMQDTIGLNGGWRNHTFKFLTGTYNVGDSLIIAGPIKIIGVGHVIFNVTKPIKISSSGNSSFINYKNYDIYRSIDLFGDGFNIENIHFITQFTDNIDSHRIIFDINGDYVYNNIVLNIERCLFELNNNDTSNNQSEFIMAYYGGEPSKNQLNKLNFSNNTILSLNSNNYLFYTITARISKTMESFIYINNNICNNKMMLNNSSLLTYQYSQISLQNNSKNLLYYKRSMSIGPFNSDINITYNDDISDIIQNLINNGVSEIIINGKYTLTKAINIYQSSQYNDYGVTIRGIGNAVLEINTTFDGTYLFKIKCTNLILDNLTINISRKIISFLLTEDDNLVKIMNCYILCSFDTIYKYLITISPSYNSSTGDYIDNDNYNFILYLINSEFNISSDNDNFNMFNYNNNDGYNAKINIKRRIFNSITNKNTILNLPGSDIAQYTNDTIENGNINITNPS